jgi:hypothetical protein
MALMMGKHARLGAQSAVQQLNDDVLKTIVEILNADKR